MSRRIKAKQPSKAPGQYGGTQKSDDVFRNAVVGRVSRELLVSLTTDSRPHANGMRSWFPASGTHYVEARVVSS